MKIKTSELKGVALDWVVAKCESVKLEIEVDKHGKTWLYEPLMFGEEYRNLYQPSNDWAQGGPIIEREKITVGYERYGASGGETWDAVKKASHEDTVLWLEYGPTPLIAAMRCYVASKLGNEVEVPDEIAN